MHPPPPPGFPSNEALVSVQPSSRRPHFLVKGEPDEASRGDVPPPTPAFVGHDQRVYVTEAPQIHGLDHSSRFKSETCGEMSDRGKPRKRDESDFSRTADSDVNSLDMPVRRPLRPW